MKIGIADAGGGMRGIYTAGIYDYCLDAGLHFDLCIGVSAGSGNLLRFVAGQDRISRKFYVTYSFRKDYMSRRNILRHGCYVNLDYAYGTLVREGGEAPLDYDALMADPAEYMAVAADIDTGEPKYFTKNDLRRNHYEPLMASSSIPLVSKPVKIGGHRYYDGALADPIPIQKLFDEGCDLGIMVLTKPADQLRQPGHDPKLADLIQHRFPQAAEALRARADRYNQGVALAKELEVEGKALVLAPADTFGVDTLTREIPPMVELYRAGYKDGRKIKEFLKQHRAL